MRLTFTDDAWQDYLYWQSRDRKILRRLNGLIKECMRTPFSGTGKPEPLKANLSGYWARRITDDHRLVYKIAEGDLLIAQCRFHY